MRRPVAGAVVALVALLAAGCSGDEVTTAPRPELPTEAPDLWNPCDALDLADVSSLFDTTFAVRTGTPESPTCSFTPEIEGDPVVDVNYQLFPDDLQVLLDTFGELEPGALTRVNGPALDAADDARVIVDVQDGTLAITGLVQNGDLVQIVNALDPAPFDRGLLRRGVRTVLNQLATRAGESGLSD